MKVAQELSLSMVFQPLGDGEFFYKHIEKLGLQTCKRIAERTSLSSVKDVEKMIKELEEKDPDTSPLSDTAKSHLLKFPFVKGFCVMAETPHIYINEEQFGNRESHKQVHDIISPYFGDHYFILKYCKKSRFVPLVSLKPGEAIFRNPSDPEKYGTLGALLKLHRGPASEKHDWYALTCEHVVGNSASMMIKIGGNTFSDFGKVVYKRDITKSEKDIAIIKINRSFYPTNTRGHINVRRDLKGIQMQKVLKMGAQTGKTYGIVVGTDCEFPDYGKEFILLCSETLSARFAEGGDSGSVVLLEDNGEVDALSILVGKFDSREDVPQLQGVGSDHTPHPGLAESEHPIACASIEDSAGSASDISGHYEGIFSPFIPKNTQVFYSDTLTASLDQIKNNQENHLGDTILDYIDEVSRHHSLLFVCGVDPRKPAEATYCMLCSRIYRHRHRLKSSIILDGNPHLCKEATALFMPRHVNNEHLKHNLARRYNAMYARCKFPRMLKHASKIRLYVQPCELKAGRNQKHDDDIDASTMRAWEGEFKSQTQMTFSKFLSTFWVHFAKYS
ncbi:uncharacterized protein LOC106168178 [Lingula anatina]|uniref:Uncharacterized protein LOC106168178 n=1 Tax=Lingula anatina TaxID=7574 RepID=A0A1S3IWM6_LINAN|nr:uncharacterized protein LOC106168178 [Lingula anatina]|eukprot:XP_013402590.1 uncharacterized protein LOC106168178 [Lingula anatina]